MKIMYKQNSLLQGFQCDAAQWTICKECNNIVSLVTVPCLGESADMLQRMSDAVAVPQHHDHSNKPEDRISDKDVIVYGFVGVDTWAANTATATILQDPVV